MNVDKSMNLKSRSMKAIFKGNPQYIYMQMMKKKL